MTATQVQSNWAGPLLASESSPTPRLASSGDAPIIVGTDGSPESAPGIILARTLSAASGAPVQLVSVVQPMRMLLPSGEGLPAPSLEDRQLAEHRLTLLREQKSSAGGGDQWTIEVKFGDAATVLTRVAKTRNARVLVLGRRPHGKVDQLLGDDTVFDVMRLAETPVLIATAPITQLPRIVTVAVDFSDLSFAAARAAVELFPSAGLIYLAHVRPAAGGVGALAAEYTDVVERGFERMAGRLDPLTGARIDTVKLSGVPARELVDFAESSRSELLVTGSYSRGLFRRLVGGAMASRLLRATPCPLLIVPQAATEDVIEESSEAGEVDWTSNLAGVAISEILDDLTRRNAGRRVLVESDSAGIGAQLLAFDFRFLAARFDSISGKAHLVLADDPVNGCQSVTHSLAQPRDIDVRRTADGNDHSVRLGSDCGLTTLTFW